MCVRFLDWAEAVAAENTAASQPGSVGHDQAHAIAPGVLCVEKFDVIIGTDILYEVSLAMQLDIVLLLDSVCIWDYVTCRIICCTLAHDAFWMQMPANSFYTPWFNLHFLWTGCPLIDSVTDQRRDQCCTMYKLQCCARSAW